MDRLRLAADRSPTATGTVWNRLEVALRLSACELEDAGLGLGFTGIWSRAGGFDRPAGVA